MRWLLQPWIAERVRGRSGVYWCAAWFALQALIAFVASVLETGAMTLSLLIAFGGLNAYVALGLLRGLKPAWHFATFLAFITIALKLLATACAPGAIADGDRTLFEAALDIMLLAGAVLVFMHLRKPAIRALYKVPESYRLESNERP